jgi:hypothetical protein
MKLSIFKSICLSVYQSSVSIHLFGPSISKSTDHPVILSAIKAVCLSVLNLATKQSFISLQYTVQYPSSCLLRTCDGWVPPFASRGTHLRVENTVIRFIALDSRYFPCISLGGWSWGGMRCVGAAVSVAGRRLLRPRSR